MKDMSQPLESPSVEEVVADDDTASLKTVSQRQWSSPTLGVPPPGVDVPVRAQRVVGEAMRDRRAAQPCIPEARHRAL